MARANGFGGNQDGAVAFFFALALVPVLVFVGAAVDYSRAARERAILQTALDGAVLAAAGNYTIAEAKLIFDNQAARAGVDDLARDITLNKAGEIVGTASGLVPTSFTELVGVSELAVGASSVASKLAPSDKVCILVKDPTGNQALLLNSGVTLKAPNCRIDVTSTGNPAAIFNSGVVLDVKKTCVKGTQTIQNGGPVKSLETGCAVAADPFAGNLPAVTVGACTVKDKNYSGTNTLSPGVYCGNFNFNGSGKLNLAPGLYVFKGTRWNLNSGWTVSGTGVTFYFADANSYIQVNSGVNLSVTAPTSGTYADILMFEPTGLSTSQFSINGSAGHIFEGLIYLPSRDLTFNSVSSVTSESLTIVVWRLILNQINWAIEPGKKAIAAGGSSGASGAGAMLVR